MSNKFRQHPVFPQGFSVTFEKRFWKRVNKNGAVPPHCTNIGPCWLWTGGAIGDGYGCMGIGVEGKTVLAHRASWMIHFGLIPNGLCVLHRCDNPICVAPHHLWLGTQLENIKDRDQKGRANGGSLPGELCHHHKLTNKQVLSIRSLSSSGGISQREIAKLFSVDQSSISAIVTGKNWKHLLPVA